MMFLHFAQSSRTWISAWSLPKRWKWRRWTAIRAERRRWVWIIGIRRFVFYWSWCHPKNLMMYKCLCGMGVLSTRGCPPWGPVFIGTVDYIQYIVCQTGPSTFFLKGQHWYTPMPPRCACSLIKPSFSGILGVYIYMNMCVYINMHNKHR